MATAKKTGPDKQADIELWEAVEKTDPNFTKPITGRSYQGTSPNVTYLLEKATALYGLAGHGFGWEVLDERWDTIQISPEHPAQILHTLRIRFWTRHPKTGEIGSIESYGGTQAGYISSRGKLILDEDAAKKSLTDAITKGMSFIGFSADIFLGRYDDNKYVTELRGEFGVSSDQPVTPNAPTPAVGGAAGGDGW